MINRKLLKEPEGKKTYYIQRNKNQYEIRPLIWNKAIQKTVDKLLKKKERKKKLVNLEFCTQ